MASEVFASQTLFSLRSLSAARDMLINSVALVAKQSLSVSFYFSFSFLVSDHLSGYSFVFA